MDFHTAFIKSISSFPAADGIVNDKTNIFLTETFNYDNYGNKFKCTQFDSFTAYHERASCVVLFQAP